MLEAVIVLCAAVEINFEAGEIGLARELQRIVAAPERGIGGNPKRVQRAQKRRLLRIRDSDVRQIFKERGAVRGHRDKTLRMREGQMQRAVAAHGDASDGARGAFRSDAIVAFDERNEFLKKEIFVAHAAIARIDVESSIRFRRDHEVFADFLLLPLVLDDVPAAGTYQKLLVVAEAVEKVENGIMP